MRADRNIEILTAGLKAAHEQLFTPAHMRRPDYPRNMEQLYSELEDEVHNMFMCVRRKDWAKLRQDAGEVISYASMMIERAEIEQRREATHEIFSH
jgi:arginyl-tRNA synthetase